MERTRAMSPSQPVLSRSVEDYLKAIYALSQRGDPAATSAIARAMEIQPASVTGMVKRLSETGLVEHIPYHGVRLTDEGRRAALRILRRHRILETYLHERLEFAWEEVHDEAERLEHAASDQLIDRMATALRNPSYDPHGSPIPTRSGEIEAFDLQTLAEVPVGATVEVREVRDDQASRLQEMEAWGLVPGTTLRVDLRERLEGPVEVGVGPNDQMRTVPFEVARRVYVAAG